MNIETYNLDSLRKLVRELQDENQKLKSCLREAGIAFETKEIFEERIENSEDYDPDQGGRLQERHITRDMAKWFFSMFWGREDVFAKRGVKGGYFPQCNNRWDNKLCPKQRGEKNVCVVCEHTDWTKLTLDRILAHLNGEREDGSDVIGIYPLLPDGTCRLLVFDFDNHEKGAQETDFANSDDTWRDEVNALRRICEENGITPLVERSRSGRGAHVWIFFKKPIAASLARNFGFMLLDKGSASVNLKSFQYYDRMYPAQDATDSIGNLIALPLQGQALKNGNSAFVDVNWNAYPDQWDILLNHIRKLTLDEVKHFMEKWKEELEEDVMASASLQNRPKPWKKARHFNKDDVVGSMHIVLGDGIYVDALNLMPRLQNQIRSMAAFDNPIYYKNRRLGYSNYYNFSAVYMGRDVDGYICIPRGLKDDLLRLCKEAGIMYDITDERGKGRPVRVAFTGDLRMQQDLAAQRLLSYDHGILSAATAFGKTVVCSYLISELKVNTLILLQSKSLLTQWTEELGRFLCIEEEPPAYKTRSGRIKRRSDVIGVLHGSKNTLTGIVDIAMIGSLSNKENLSEILDSYGMIIMDECHHAASDTAVKVLQRVKSRYVYGVSATPQRSDNLEKITFMLIGPIRHSYTAKERAVEQGIGHFVYPRYTRVVDLDESKQDINAAFALVSKSGIRNEMILDDVRVCVAKGRTPIVLTKHKDHAKYLFDHLRDAAEHVFLLYGDNSEKENAEIQRELRKVPKGQSVILVATGQKIGEGFDYPRLDTLMLAAPVSFAGRLEQYVGRLNRDYEGKKDVIVYDYVDSHIRFFDNMYARRLRTYKKIGFEVISDIVGEKQIVRSIYDHGDYLDVFERDIVESEKRVVVSSPELTQDKVERFLYLMRPRQEAGIKVMVITTEPDNISYGDVLFCRSMIQDMERNGIHVILQDEVAEHFAIIDEELVWHGGMNLLGKEDAWDNLMRIRSKEVAAELLEITMEGV